MPRRDGTGPWGNGSRRGKGQGICNGANSTGAGTGLGQMLGRCFGRGFGMAANTSVPKTEKERLLEQKMILEKELSSINQQLDSI